MVALRRVVADPRPPLAALAELVEDPADLDLLLELRAPADSLARDAMKALAVVAAADRYRGPHAAVVMAPFLMLGPSRFSAGTYGVLYAANEMDVAVRESAYHAAAKLAASSAPPGRVSRFAITMSLDDRNVADVRLASGGDPAIYDANVYTAAQRVGRDMRTRGHDGLWYDSVRAPGGTCYAVFRPAAITTVEDASDELAFVWDGSRIDRYEIVRTFLL